VFPKKLRKLPQKGSLFGGLWAPKSPKTLSGRVSKNDQKMTSLKVPKSVKNDSKMGEFFKREIVFEPPF